MVVVPSTVSRHQFQSIRLVVFDFDGVFTNNAVYVAEDGTETVRCCRSDGIGLRKLERLGIEVLILSTEENPVVTSRSRKLKVPCVQGCQDKEAALRAIAVEKRLSLQQIAFVGNDVNDLSCLRIVGLPVVVADAYDEVVGTALWQTERVGGSGAVREVCDAFEFALQGSG
jgi:YrbI family 3-deoxy-D-manno-octulosonate 8-phosphate phosphatase